MEARTEHPGKAKAQQKGEGWFGGQGGCSGTAPMAAFLPRCAGGLSHGKSLPEVSSSKARSCKVACVRHEAMPAQPGSVPNWSCQPGAEGGEGTET